MVERQKERRRKESGRNKEARCSLLSIEVMTVSSVLCCTLDMGEAIHCVVFEKVAYPQTIPVANIQPPVF